MQTAMMMKILVGVFSILRQSSIITLASPSPEMVAPDHKINFEKRSDPDCDVQWVDR
ncbi:hypothetical protein Pst134EA_015414 [Puccinia striiformis f. sp. tritici]|uniref:hypothetical protein n=1 Tax=Puccinia striiformis f. sp. tritici TaxID=168172 RepID=UPI00200849FE|nr:hypothetical protein Pst134EA_015414 [Puccinia striiformis f. sp. tritici]KAH9463330.1 hypothetical protein Pst134EA_015414 [Puccinia striiformis f. sp. tritici]